ncbi:hypothetical protein EV714DRAFT_287148 [Schizophyllum commune]
MDSPPQLSLLATAFDTLLSLSQSSDGLGPRGDGHELLSEHDREKDLRRLCLVSRVWKDTAEPVLWQSLDSLRPLFNLIPNDAIPMDHAYRYAPPLECYNDEVGRLRERRREFVPEDWPAWRRLARLVRSVHIDFAINREDQQRILRLRAIELRSRPCIPINPAFLRLLLAPTITEVCQHPTVVPATSWSYIVAALPSLTHLKLRTEDTSAEFCCALVQALGAHPTVQRVSLTFDSASSSTGLLPGLAACPALHDLRVYVMDMDDDDRRAVVPCQGFSALRHLYCIGTSLPFLRSVLSSRLALALSTLSADVRMRAAADLHAILGTIGAHVDRGTLTHIGVSNAHWNMARAPIPLGPHALRALSGSRALALADADWRAAAGWWPKLERLRIEVDAVADPAGAGVCPLAALGHLARSCPHLAHLELPVDATVAPDAVGAPAIPHTPACLQLFIYPRMSPIADASAVARYLAGISPALQAVVAESTGLPPHMRKIGEYSSLIREPG